MFAIVDHIHSLGLRQDFSLIPKPRTGEMGLGFRVTFLKRCSGILELWARLEEEEICFAAACSSCPKRLPCCVAVCIIHRAITRVPHSYRQYSMSPPRAHAAPSLGMRLGRGFGS